MNLYAVKNDQGKWLCIEANGSHYWSRDDGDFFDQHDADTLAHVYGGQVVPLIEAPEKVVLNEKEAKLIEQLGNNISDCFPAGNIADYIDENWAEYGDHNRALDERRLIDALVNGYTVAKEKEYNVKVPLVQAQGGLWFYINSDDKLDATYSQELAKKFTIDEIEENGLQDCEKEEVKD